MKTNALPEAERDFSLPLSLSVGKYAMTIVFGGGAAREDKRDTTRRFLRKSESPPG